MSAGELLRYRGVLTAVLGAGIFIGAAVISAFRYVFQERRRRLLQQHLARLDSTVAELQQELLALRNVREVSGRKNSLKSNSSRSSRLSRRSRKSEYETDGEMFSALDTDDEEFFDLTSDEEELLLRAVSATENPEEVEKLFQDVDSLFNGNEEDKDKAYDLLQQNLVKFSANSNFLWRLAKAHHAQTKKTNNKETKKELIMQGLEFAKDALALDISNADAHKWYAILIGMMGDYVSTKERIENGYVFQQHVRAALECKPDDYSLHHLAGRFKYELASLPWIQRKVANTIFAEIPSVTFQDAITDFQNAEELNEKQWKENRFYLAKCYIGEGQYKTALEWLDKAKEIEAQNQDDRSCDEEIDALISKYERHRNRE